MDIPNSSDFCTRQLYAYAEHGWVQSVGHTGLGHFVYTKCVYRVNPMPLHTITVREKEIVTYGEESSPRATLMNLIEKVRLGQLIGGIDEQVKINDLRRRRNEGI